MHAGVQISQRRACGLMEMARSTARRQLVESTLNQTLQARIIDLAQARRRFGYRRIHDLLRREGVQANHKRFYRLYSEARLSVRKRRRRKLVALDRQVLQEATYPNEVWSVDFVMDALSTGRRIKCLTVGDDFTRECLDIAVDFGISGEYVARVLDQIAQFRGFPRSVRTDQGPEFISRALDQWAYGKGVDNLGLYELQLGSGQGGRSKAIASHHGVEFPESYPYVNNHIYELVLKSLRQQR